VLPERGKKKFSERRRTLVGGREGERRGKDEERNKRGCGPVGDRTQKTTSNVAHVPRYQLCDVAQLVTWHMYHVTNCATSHNW
jgi:hypothetical protein